MFENVEMMLDDQCAMLLVFEARLRSSGILDNNTRLFDVHDVTFEVHLQHSGS